MCICISCCIMSCRQCCDSICMLICAQGRIHQIEYAMEAVKQGSATVGLKSKTHAVLVALKVKKTPLVSCVSCFVDNYLFYCNIMVIFILRCK